MRIGLSEVGGRLQIADKQGVAIRRDEIPKRPQIHIGSGVGAGPAAGSRLTSL